MPACFFLQDTDTLETLLITLAKAVIFKARNAGTKPSIEHMMKAVHIEAQKEHFNSRLSNQLDSFEQKWKTLGRILR